MPRHFKLQNRKPNSMPGRIKPMTLAEWKASKQQKEVKSDEQIRQTQRPDVEG
jgi:hypothetical protein